MRRESCFDPSQKRGVFFVLIVYRYSTEKESLGAHMVASTNKLDSLTRAHRSPFRSAGDLRGLAQRVRGCLLTLAVMLSLLSKAQIASAQQITGTITGTVTDAVGAVVPNAAVMAKNTATGYTRSTESDSAGAYTVQYLPVGTYIVEITAPGFKKFVQQDLEIAVDVTQALNATLAVGATTETVEVTAAAPLVNTTTETIGRTVTPAEINQLPLVNRNAYTEISLTPGVQSNSASSQSNPSGTPNFVIGVPSTQVVINGGVDAGVPMVGFYLDGGINMTGLRNYGNAVPNPDALEEFRVETSNFAPQYGRMSGGVVTVVTKSGTNSFHGSVFEFVRNTLFNATNWGVPVKPAYHRNQFGVTVGGPIQRDKMFFFFSYGGLRQIVPQPLTGAIVLSANQRTGDFTALNPGAAAIAACATKVSSNCLYFPGTHTIIHGTNSSQNCQTDTPYCIPSSLLDPTAANIIKTYVPLPNGANNTWAGSVSIPTNEDEYLGKFDWNISDRDHLLVSYFNIGSFQGAFGGAGTSAYIPFTTNNSIARQQNANISEIHTFGGTAANQVWLTYTRVAGGRVNTPTVSLGNLGSKFTIQGPPTLPELQISGWFSAGGALAGPVSNTNFYGLRDVYSRTIGRHQLNVGGEFSLEKDPIQGNLYNFGIFNFQTSGPTTTNVPGADFVTGSVSSMEQDAPYHALMNFFYGAGFFQDSWKMTPRFTANLGIRYDVQQSPVESSNLTTALVPGQQSTLVPSAPKGVLFPGDAGIPRGIAPTEWGHVSPRVGVAWDVFGNGKTAVRAGVGWFYGSVSMNEWNQPANAQPFTVRQTFFSITSLTNPYGNPLSFPNGNPFPYHYTPSNPTWLSNAAVESIDPHYKWPASYQLNGAVQQQFSGGLSAQVAYVGNFVRHVPFGTDGNNPVYSTGATSSNINNRRPIDPGVLGAVTLITSEQTANYNSLQVSVHKRMLNHLLLDGFYVWSHSLWSSANNSAIGMGIAQNFTYLNEERGPSDNDRRSVVSISGIWNIDYYRGDSGWAKQLANGWKLSTIVSLQSGNPYNITTGSDKNLDGYNNDRPNLVPGQDWHIYNRPSRTSSAFRWFNVNAFTPNGPGLGVGPGGADGTTPRDYMIGPGYRDVDLALQRDFMFGERIGFQLRAEATNAFNMVSLANPTANLSSGNNGKVTAQYGPPRLMQLGARLTF